MIVLIKIRNNQTGVSFPAFFVYQQLQKQNISVEPVISLTTILIAFVILLVIYLVNLVTIKKYISVQ